MITFKDLGYQGRFGNQLFQVASTIGIASRLGREATFPTWKNYDHALHNPGRSIEIQGIFQNPLNTYPHPEKLQQWPTRVIPFGYYDTLRFPKHRFSLSGFLQSEKYFRHVKDFIQVQFATNDRPPETNKTVCSIHVRRTDFVGSIYTLPDINYYLKAISRMTAEGFRKFCVFSDDIDAAVEMFFPHLESLEEKNATIKFCEIDGYVNRNVDGSEEYIRDFLAMKSCGAHIISNSTFAWWAAYLSKSECVICPRNWFRPEIRDMNDRDIPVEEWIKLDV